jgi:hypothetical protein
VTEVLRGPRLNRALLARQHLLERTDMPLTAMVEAMGGIQMQYAPSGYIGLWTRLARFDRTALTRALEGRELIQATLMRGTIHTVSARDYWPMVAGIRLSRREWYERVTARDRGDIEIDRVADDVRAILADGPLRQKEIEARLSERGWPARALGWSHVAVDLVRVPPSGTWERRRADIYRLAEQWLPIEHMPTESEGVRLLLERYLAAFGPARVHDFADWAGITLARARDAVAESELARYADEQGRELIDIPGAPLPPDDAAAPVRFLPTWDALLLVHARRTGVLPEEFRQRIFNIRMPQSIGTFLVDGRVAGTWRYDTALARVAIEELMPLSARARRLVDEEAARLALFHAS